MISVRPEQEEDVATTRRINESAFETTAEADIVDRLRSRGKLVVSLLGEAEGRPVGHIAFSPVTLDSMPDLRRVGLGPMAVELRPDALVGASGLVSYEAEFNQA